MMVSKDQTGRPEWVIGPVGEKLTKADLPPSDTSRWTILRKAQVVAAVNGRLLTLNEACKLYQLSVEELASWQRAIDREGMLGLRVTRVQEHREKRERPHRRR